MLIAQIRHAWLKSTREAENRYV